MRTGGQKNHVMHRHQKTNNARNTLKLKMKCSPLKKIITMSAAEGKIRPGQENIGVHGCLSIGDIFSCTFNTRYDTTQTTWTTAFEEDLSTELLMGFRSNNSIFICQCLWFKYRLLHSLYTPTRGLNKITESTYPLWYEIVIKQQDNYDNQLHTFETTLL